MIFQSCQKKKKNRNITRKTIRLFLIFAKKVKDLDVKSKTQNSDWKLQENSLSVAQTVLCTTKHFIQHVRPDPDYH